MANGFIQMTAQEQKDLVTKLEGEFQRSEKHARSVRRRWYLIDRYLEGVQWAATDAGITGYLSTAFLNNFNVDLTNPDEKFIVDNIMLRIHMTNVSRLTRYEPQIEVSPNDASDKYKIAARKGRIALYDLNDKCEFDKVKLAAADDLTRYGKTFTWVVYDPSEGEVVPRAKTDGQGNLVLDPATGEPVMEMRPQGAVVIEAGTPKEHSFPPDATDMRTADWVGRARIKSVEWAERKYGVKVDPEVVTWEETSSDGSYRSDFDSDKSRNEQNRVLVKERWYRPCEAYPQGAILTWASGVLLQSKVLTKWYPDIPCFDATNVFVNGSIWGDTPMFHLIIHQNEVNKSESNVARHAELTTRPKLLVHRGTNISEKAFTNDTGEMIEWSGEHNLKPEWLHAPELPNLVYEHINRHVDRMMSIGYAHDISRSKNPGSGTSIAYLQEIDETTMQPMVQSMTSMYQRAWQMALKLMARHYKTARLAKMFDNNSWQIEEEFKGEDLFGNFDVRVNMLAGLPANKLARQQFVMQMFQAQLIDQPTAQKYLELGDAEAALREAAIEVEVAAQNIKMIEQGQVVPVHDWDNHMVLIQEYEKNLRQRWRGYPPEVLQVFELQLQMHKEFLALQVHPANATDGGLPGMLPAAAGGGPGGAKARNLAVGNESPPPPGVPGEDGGMQPMPAMNVQTHNPGR